MSLKHTVSDTVFRFKLFLGSAALGGFIAAVFYPLYLFNFPEADLIRIFRIIHQVFQTDPTSSWLMVVSGAGLAFWMVWMIVSRPWRRTETPPEAGAHTVKKPW